MKKLNGVPAHKPEHTSNGLEKKASAILLKHKALMDGLAKYD